MILPSVSTTTHTLHVRSFLCTFTQELEAEDTSSDPSIASVDELGGDYDAPSGSAVVGGFQEAWSSDASGEAIDTRYEINGNTLTQVVDTTDAAFPVTSGPIPLVANGVAAVARALISAIFRQGAKALATQTIKAGVKAKGWNARWIHNRNNLVSIPKEVHQKCVNSWMARKNVSKFGVKSEKQDPAAGRAFIWILEAALNRSRAFEALRRGTLIFSR